MSDENIKTTSFDISQINYTSTLNTNSDSIEESGVITEQMVQEELLLEQKTLKEEEELRNQILQQNKMHEEQCFKRLQHLLSRSNIYSQYVAKELMVQEEEIKKQNLKEQLKERQKLKVIQQESSLLHSKQPSAKDSMSKSKRLSNKTKNMSEYPLPKKYKKQSMIPNVFTKDLDQKNIHMKEDVIDKYSRTINDTKISDKQPCLFIGGIMRPYQIEGFEWLKVIYENGLNAILADEMGLGKTIQSIALIAHMVEMGIPGPYLVVAPLTTLNNWFFEFKRFTPQIPILLYHGIKNARGELRLKIKEKVNVLGSSIYPVVITSYQIVLQDRLKLRNIEWKYLIVDEAHRIKNFHCKLVRELKLFNTENRLLLTGTPLQNNLAELWSLLNFILPEIFDDLAVFESWFDINHLSQKDCTQEIIAKEQEKQIVSMIHQILTPFLLRRTKAEVELTLPPKKEVVVNAPLTSLQKTYYNAVINKTIKNLLYKSDENDSEVDITKPRSKRNLQRIDYKAIEDKYSNDFIYEEVITPSTSFKSSINISNENLSEINVNTKNVMMLLRKICLHPYLICYPCDAITGEYKINEEIISSSGKMLVLDLMLAELKKRDHKVLIFSQFTTMLDILQDYLIFRNFEYNRLDGNMSLPDREIQIKNFNESKSSFIFLISTRAGGLGINLTSADTVIIYDSDWNPQIDLQAQDRCHRIGQTKPVVVYRLVVENSIDEKIVDRASVKRKLEKVIIQKGRFNSKNTFTKSQTAITRDELCELLQSSDFEGFVKTEENNVLSKSELDALLDRSEMLASNQ